MSFAAADIAIRRLFAAASDTPLLFRCCFHCSRLLCPDFSFLRDDSRRAAIDDAALCRLARRAPCPTPALFAILYARERESADGKTIAARYDASAYLPRQMLSLRGTLSFCRFRLLQFFR